jgi:hypothetical protein
MILDQPETMSKTMQGTRIILILLAHHAETSTPSSFRAWDRIGGFVERTMNRLHSDCDRPFLDSYTTQSYTLKAGG